MLERVSQRLLSRCALLESQDVQLLLELVPVTWHSCAHDALFESFSLLVVQLHDVVHVTDVNHRPDDGRREAFALATTHVALQNW